MGYSRKIIGKNRNLRKRSRKGGAPSISPAAAIDSNVPFIVDWTTNPIFTNDYTDHIICQILSQLERINLTIEGTILKRDVNELILDYTNSNLYYNRREIDKKSPFTVNFLQISEGKTKVWAPVVLVFVEDDRNKEVFKIVHDKYVVFNTKGTKLGENDGSIFDINSYDANSMEVKDKVGSRNDTELLDVHRRGFKFLSHILRQTYEYNSQKAAIHGVTGTILGYTPACMAMHCKLFITIKDIRYFMILPAVQKHLSEDKPNLPVVIYKAGPGGSVDSGIITTLQKEFREEIGVEIPREHVSENILDKAFEIEISVKGNDVGFGHEGITNEHPVNINAVTCVEMKFDSIDSMKRQFSSRTDKEETGGFYLVPVKNFQTHTEEGKMVKFSDVEIVGNPNKCHVSEKYDNETKELTLYNGEITNSKTNKPIKPCDTLMSQLKTVPDYLRSGNKGDPKFSIKSKAYNIEKIASGLKWTKIGKNKPKKGTELENKALSDELKKKQAFTQEEFDIFNISDLMIEQYIRSGEFYYKPSEILSEMVDIRDIEKNIIKDNTVLNSLYKMLTIPNIDVDNFKNKIKLAATRLTEGMPRWKIRQLALLGGKKRRQTKRIRRTKKIRPVIRRRRTKKIKPTKRRR